MVVVAPAWTPPFRRPLRGLLFFGMVYPEFRSRFTPGFIAPHLRCFQTRRRPMVNAKHRIDTGYKTTSFQLCEAMSNMNATSFINQEGTNYAHDA